MDKVRLCGLPASWHGSSMHPVADVPWIGQPANQAYVVAKLNCKIFARLRWLRLRSRHHRIRVNDLAMSRSFSCVLSRALYPHEKPAKPKSHAEKELKN